MIDIKKTKSIFILFLMMFSMFYFIPVDSSFASVEWWDGDWSFRQKIKIPFSTAEETAKYQPVDLRVSFENPCWVENDEVNSVRICAWDGSTWYELESQIYDLDHIDGKHVKSCSLVFLVPGWADGQEEYYVYYDDQEKNPPRYKDHVEISESYYRYEPISGYPLESYYYKLIDDGYIVYAVSQKGQFMGYNTAQHVTRMKEKTTVVKPKNGELLAAFDFKYCYDSGVFDYSSTSQKLLSKNILVDGNLMVEFVIVSTSKLNDLKTTVTYKYYHCPTSNTRIHTHVKHETLKKIQIPPFVRTDGTYASLQCQAVKSTSIKGLNIGEIYPFMHFQNELNTVTEYEVDTDPEYIPQDPDIRILSIQDDVDLGVKPWISFDEGENGISHAVIFNTNKVIKNGVDEKNGLQINAFQMDYPHLPGLENNLATIQIGRNSYENNTHDLVIPRGFVAEFDAEFFSSENQGVNVIPREAEIFQKLVKIKPGYEEKSDISADDSSEKHSLTVFVHLAESTPMGSAFSALLGKNFSYVNAELYKNDEFLRSATTLRLPMKAINDFDKLGFLEKIKAVMFSFDWKNLSFFKKIKFQDLKPGGYVVKIYKENSFLKKQRKYIGFKTVDIKKDTEIHIFCHSEGKYDLLVVDQNNKPVKDSLVKLRKNGFVIAECETDKNGRATIKAPFITDHYSLEVIYNDFLVYQDQIKLKPLIKTLSKPQVIKINRYDLNLQILDTWGLPPGVELNLFLTDEKSNKSTSLVYTQKTVGAYLFKNILPGNYELKIYYKSFSMEKNIHVENNENITVEFPASFKIHLKVLDNRGGFYTPRKIEISRQHKKFILEKNNLSMSLPPGEYHINVYNDADEIIGSETVHVGNNLNVNLVTNTESFVNKIVLTLAAALFAVLTVLSYFKKEVKYLIFLIIATLILISVTLPWWSITDLSSDVESNTNLYIFPSVNLITLTKAPGVIHGETSYLPDNLISAYNLIPFLSFLGLTSFSLCLFLDKNKKEKLCKTLMVFSMILLVASAIVFIVGLNALTDVTVGSMFGEGILKINIPNNDEINELIHSTWGLNYGFLLYVITIVLLLIYYMFIYHQYFVRRLKELWLKTYVKKRKT